jgi:hypothetical protein
MNCACKAERFEKDTAGHALSVLLDNGQYRHLTARRPDTFAYHFHITTWPGYLAISGDMGCYVFARLPDMLNFFRSSSGEINPGYWHEKLQADNARSPSRVLDMDAFRNAVQADFDACEFEDDNLRECAWGNIEDDILSRIDRQMTAREAICLAQPYEIVTHHGQSPVSPFSEIWDRNVETYSFGFIWACRAIVWAINRYDKQTDSEGGA